MQISQYNTPKAACNADKLYCSYTLKIEINAALVANSKPLTRPSHQHGTQKNEDSTDPGSGAHGPFRAAYSKYMEER